MPSTLAQLETRVSAMLADVANAVFSTSMLDEAMRTALSDLNAVAPYAMETVITLPGAGREIALNGVADLLYVQDVWWPYVTTQPNNWPPNRAKKWRVWWDDGSPVLFLTDINGALPATSESLRLWYAKAHTIQNLDSASMTTLGSLEGLIVRGCAGYACFTRSVDVNETTVLSGISTPNYGALGDYYLNQPKMGFYEQLEKLRRSASIRSEPFPEYGWTLDEWDV